MASSTFNMSLKSTKTYMLRLEKIVGGLQNRNLYFYNCVDHITLVVQCSIW